MKHQCKYCGFEFSFVNNQSPVVSRAVEIGTINSFGSVVIICPLCGEVVTILDVIRTTKVKIHNPRKKAGSFTRHVENSIAEQSSGLEALFK